MRLIVSHPQLTLAFGIASGHSMDYLGKDDPLFDAVRQMVIETGKSSISRIQRKYLIGYNRVAAMISALADEGIIMRNEQDEKKVQHGEINADSNKSLQLPIIKVMGIGGCGINAINQMIEIGIQGTEFIAISPDTNELARSKADQSLYFPYRQEMPPARSIITIPDMDRRNIKALIAGSDIIFIVAGMGSSTGTSIAPIAAKIARELGILSVAVVSMPFLYEGNRPHRAKQGVQELTENADALVIIPNSMLLTKADMRVSDVFYVANDLMRIAVSGVAESISSESLISLDVHDLRMILSDAGIVSMGTACVSGTARAKAACELAITTIFPSKENFTNARSILVNITASSSLRLREVAEILECVHLVAMDAEIVTSAVFDESMGDVLRLTLFTTALKSRHEEA